MEETKKIDIEYKLHGAFVRHPRRADDGERTEAQRVDPVRRDDHREWQVGVERAADLVIEQHEGFRASLGLAQQLAEPVAILKQPDRLGD